MAGKITYLNTAAFGLVDPEAKAVADTFYTNLAGQGSPVGEAWRTETEPRIRQTIAGFLGADVANIALLPNFSWGMNAVVQSLSGKERVLLYRGDFPSVWEPFRLNHFDIRWIDASDDFALPLNIIEQLTSSREVDIVALSHVQYNSGYKLPIAGIGALCREHGVRFIVDATQSLGAMPIDVSGLDVDVLIASNYKWMNAGFGTAIMYIGNGFLKEYPPVVGGFNRLAMQDGEWMHTHSARSYEPGHPNMYGLTLLEAAILLRIQQIGLGHIEAYNATLTNILLQGISGLGLPLIGPATMDDRSSIVLLRDEGGLSGWIRDAGFVVTSRGGRIRISMHHYNTEDEVQALISCLKERAASM